MQKKSLKSGFGFGMGSGVITTLGLMVGLYFTTYSKGIVISGIITIAIADACSDALGMHFSEETEGAHTTKEIWMATLTTFISKFFIALSFLPLVVFLPLKIGVVLNIIWGFLLLGVYSYVVALLQKNNPLKAVCEHFSIMIVVIYITYLLGNFLAKYKEYF